LSFASIISSGKCAMLRPRAFKLLSYIIFGLFSLDLARKKLAKG